MCIRDSTIAEKGGIDVILAAMKQHPDSTGVQEEGCWALGQVAYYNAARSHTIAEKGGIEAAFRAMTQHSHHEKVQQQGCYALGKVAWNNDANRRTIAEKGGIEAAFRAMTQHSHDEDVQRWGCYMMCRMVDCASVRPAIREGKAVMDAARNNFPNNDSIKNYLDAVYGKI